MIVLYIDHLIELLFVYNLADDDASSELDSVLHRYSQLPPMDKAQSEEAGSPSARAVLVDLRERISSQTLLPGARITEEEVAKAYNITRAKAREVLATLEDRNLIERIPNKGAVVAFVDMEATYKLYEVREALDGLTVRLATQNTKPEDWKDMQESLGEPFERSLREGDIDGHIATIERFRGRLRQAADNDTLTDLSERVYERTRVTMRRVALLPGRAEMGITQYRAVLAAIVKGDADEAEQKIRELNRSAREYMLRYKNFVL